MTNRTMHRRDFLKRAAAGLAVGDSLPVRVAGAAVTLRVVGLITGADESARSGLRDVLLMDVGGAQVALGRVGSLNRIDLILPE